MQSVNLITNRLNVLISFLVFSTALSAQENSPFSRYGMGDIYPDQHIASRAMGGLSAAYINGQAINTINPASYGSLRLVTYDFGVSIDQRSLRSADLTDRFKSTNFIPSYLTIAAPVNSKKRIGLVFGLRPATRINYSIENIERTSIDSMRTLYEGNGGLNQAFFGLGKGWKNLSIGVNAGLGFGRKETATKISFLNDSVQYYKSNSSATASFWGFFVNPGIMYNIKLNEVTNTLTRIRETYTLQLGGSATLKQRLNASQNVLRETFTYDANGGIIKIDSVFAQNNITGKIDLPLTYTAGFMITKIVSNGILSNAKWGFGADYTAGKWTDYRYYGQPDKLIDSRMIHAGGEFTPNPLGTGFWNHAVYRAGFYTGKDYINADGNDYKVQAFTFGAGFHLRKFRSYDNQFTFINTSFEFGKRGSTVNNVTENFFKFSVGFSLSDIWFVKRRYD